MKILVTVLQVLLECMFTRLLKDGHEVKGLDNLNDYYDVKLKLDRLKNIEAFQKLLWKSRFKRRTRAPQCFFSKFLPEVVINLAAQAGVRNSLNDPYLTLTLISGIYECFRILSAS